MKRTILSALVIALISCNSKTTNYVQKKADTIRTAAIYMGGSGYIEGGLVYRITKDTFALDTINSETMKKKWKRDTAYFIPQTVPMTDSLGKAMFDSLGKPQQTIRYFPTPNKNILEDYNKVF
jgi:hypothetical protein